MIANYLAPRPSCCLQRAHQGHGWCRRSLGCSPWSPHSALSPSSCTGGCTWATSIQSWSKKIFARLPDAPASSYCSRCKLGEALRSFFISETFDNWSRRRGNLVAPVHPLHGLGCWSLHCCGRFRGLREIDCCTTLLLIFCLILGTSWTCWNVKLLAMRYVFRNPSSPKSSLSFISFDSILQFFSVNIALTSPTISFLSVVYCTKNRYHTNFFAWEDGTPSSYSCCASSQSSLCRCILGERSSLVLEYMYYVPRPRNCCGSENLNEKKPMPIQFVHTRLCKKSRQEHLDLIQKFFSICEN